MARVKLTAGRVRDFTVRPDQQQSFLWDTEAPWLAVRATVGAKVYIFQSLVNGKSVRIRIGDVEFRVVKPCSRCILTTIDPQTGERDANREPFATLNNYRKQEGGAMFGQNLVNDSEGVLEVGMPVTILE